MRSDVTHGRFDTNDLGEATYKSRLRDRLESIGLDEALVRLILERSDQHNLNNTFRIYE